MEKNDDSPEDVKRATSVEREIKRGEKDDMFEGYPRQEKKKRWEHCDNTPSKKSKRQKAKANGDCCETRNGQKRKTAKFTKVSVFGEPCTLPKVDVIPRHCLTKQHYLKVLSTPSRRCPPDCHKRTVIRRLKPVSQRIKELAQPTRQRMLISLQQGAATLPPALLDNLVRTLENETCLTPEQAAIVSRKKKLGKKKREKRDTWRQKESSKLSKPSIGAASAGLFDKDSALCQYLIAERFVKSILKWKCPIPKSEFSDVSKVIEKRLVETLEYSAPQNEDRKSQQLRFLADVIACWISGVLSDVAKDQEEKLQEECKRKEEEMLAAEEEEDEETGEDEDEGEYDDEDEDEDEEEDEEGKEERDEGQTKDSEREKDKDEVTEDDGKGVEETSPPDMDESEKSKTEGVTESETQEKSDDADREDVGTATEEVVTVDKTVETETDPDSKKQEADAQVDHKPVEAKPGTGVEEEQGMEEEDKAKAEAEAEAKRQAELETEAKRKTELEAEAKRKAEAEAEAEAKRQAELEAEAKRKAELEAEEAEKKAKMEAEEAEKKAETPTTAETEEKVVAAEKLSGEEVDRQTTEPVDELPTESEIEQPEDTVAHVESKEREEIGKDETETKVSSVVSGRDKVAPEEDKWKDIAVMRDLEELFKTDLPFVTFGKIIDTIYKMIESTPENTGEDPITNGIHRVIYEKLTNIVMLEDPNLLTEELKDVVDVVCGKIANWLKSILSTSQVSFMEKYIPVVESKEIRDWTKWLEHVSNVAIDWNIWLRGVIEKIFEMRGAKVTRGEWQDWTRSVDAGALLWRRFHMQTIHQAHHNIAMMIGRRVVKTGTKGTLSGTSEQLLNTTELHT